MNPRPSAPKADALPSCATLRKWGCYSVGQTKSHNAYGAMPTLGCYPVRDPRSRQPAHPRDQLRQGTKPWSSSPVRLLGGPFGGSRTHKPRGRFILNEVCLPVSPRRVLYAVVFRLCRESLTPPPITKVYHKQTSAVYSKRGLPHPFKSRSTSSRTSVFVTRYLYVEILVG